jgi:hypothetical protein
MTSNAAAQLAILADALAGHLQREHAELAPKHH